MLKSTRYFQITALATILLSCMLVSYSTWCGSGFTYDSFDYFAASRSWQTDKELINENGSLYVFHAPLFPIVLSAIGHNFKSVYFLLNLAICCLSASILYHITKKLFISPVLHLAYIASVVLSVGFQMAHHFLWTESMFLLLFIMHNYFFWQYLESHGRGDFWLLILMGFLMGITKNTGFFIILGTGLALYLQGNKRRLSAAAIYAFIASAGFALWNLAVVFYRGGDTMYRESGFLKGSLTNLHNYADVITLWFIPSAVPFGLRLSIFFFFGLSLLYLSSRRILSKKAVSLLIQVASYLLIMIFIIEVDQDEIERLLAIVALWFMLVVFMTIDTHWIGCSKKVRSAMIVVLFLFLSYTCIRSYKNVDMWHDRKCDKEILSIYQDNDL